MKNLFLLVLVFSTTPAFMQELARFSVSPRSGAGVTPVAISLDRFIYSTDNGSLALFEVTTSGEKEIPCQLEPGNTAKLWFVFDNAQGERNYVIRYAARSTASPAKVLHTHSEQGVTLRQGSTPVLFYNHAEVFPPEGVDIKYKRSGFIHPLWSPGGEVLTSIQPPDHYHHYGIWNPWTKTTIDDRQIDFWNLVKGQGTVKFAGYLDALEGDIFAGFKVKQEHVFFQEDGREKVAINEVWDVRVWNTGIKNVSVVDLTTTLNTPLAQGIMLDAYRYGGGLGYRATGKWHKDNCTVLTSEGKTRADADGAKARWCIVEGETGMSEGRSGILFLSHPANRKHPEPMRVWPPDANNKRGDMFLEFCPIRHDDWKLEPGRNYVLKYRMIVFDGKLSPAEAERYWKGFAAAPVIKYD